MFITFQTRYKLKKKKKKKIKYISKIKSSIVCERNTRTQTEPYTRRKRECKINLHKVKQFRNVIEGIHIMATIFFCSLSKQPTDTK